MARPKGVINSWPPISRLRTEGKVGLGGGMDRALVYYKQTKYSRRWDKQALSGSSNTLVPSGCHSVEMDDE